MNLLFGHTTSDEEKVDSSDVQKDNNFNFDFNTSGNKSRGFLNMFK